MYSRHFEALISRFRVILLMLLILTSTLVNANGTGLDAKYWNFSVVDNNYQFPTTRANFNRVDPTIDFNWGSGSPHSSISRDDFAVRWEGEIAIDETGVYQFHTQSDDGIRLWVDGQLVINNWSLHAPTWDTSPALTLTANQRYHIKMEFFEHSRGAVSRLYWQTPSRNSRHVVPQSQLYPTVTPKVLSTNLENPCDNTTSDLIVQYNTSMKTGNSNNSAERIRNYSLSPNVTITNIQAISSANEQFRLTLDQRLAPNTSYTLTISDVNSADNTSIAPNPSQTQITTTGVGLKADYWNFYVVNNGYNFPTTSANLTRIDADINFNWGEGSPANNISGDGFAVRWTGSVLAPTTGNYRFSTLSDDGVRLWVDDQLVIDNWTLHGPTYDDSPTVQLTAGKRYNIRMEFFEHSIGAVAQLLWRTPNDNNRQIIPTSALSPCSPPRNASSVAEYRFDEANWSNTSNDVIDSSPNNNHGMAINTQPVEGLVCNAADFSANATNDYISLNRAALNNASDFSISVWAKTSNRRSQSIVSGSSGRQHNELIMWFPRSSRFQPHLKGRNAGSIPITNIANNQWHHLVWTRSGTENCLYVDGVRSTCRNLSNQPVSIANGGLIIGQEQDSLGGRFDINQDFEGLLDELIIFDYPLSATEVSDIRSNHLAGNGWDGQPRTCPTSNLDHFEISYSKSGLTCQPSAITIKACADATCSSLITDDVDITLSPINGWSNNNVTIQNGQTTLNLSHPMPGNVTLGVTSSSITPANAPRCMANNSPDSSCSIDVAETGFIFDIPVLTACKTSANITIRAVKDGIGPSRCVSALTGDKTLSFWSDYDTPTSGTKQVQINGSPIATNSSATPINLTFNAQGEAQFTVQYADAGRLNLNAKYDDNNDLVMTGINSFVSKPVALISYSEDNNADCPSQNANCSLFKEAGESFNLNIKAACWTEDNDTNFIDNPVTPNFELAGININHSVVAPSPGVNGEIDKTNFNFDRNTGIHTLQQTISEVGVFEFTLSPTVSYFGETINTETSPAIGRFVPNHFKATTGNVGNFNSECTGFSYSGQTFTYRVKPQLLITAYNTDDEVTRNYRGDFAKLQDMDFTITRPVTDAAQLGSDNSTLVALNWQPAAVSLNDNNDGTLTFEFGNDQYTYRHEANSRIAPFTNAVDLTFTSISDSDNISATGLPHTLQPSGESIRFGRIAIDSTHGSELVPLTTGIRAEYFNGFSWIENTADACTVINQTNHIGLRNPDTSGGALQSGNTTMTIGAGSTTATLTNANPLSSGSASLTLSAPGQDNQGYVDVSSRIGANYPWLLGDYDNDGGYDDEAQGRVSFGLFRGSNNIIFRREQF